MALLKNPLSPNHTWTDFAPMILTALLINACSDSNSAAGVTLGGAGTQATFGGSTSVGSPSGGATSSAGAANAPTSGTSGGSVSTTNSGLGGGGTTSASSGGSPSTGGRASGGTATGGSSTTGGALVNGGAPNGGTNPGSGGAATGGASPSTGGRTGICAAGSYPAPNLTVSATVVATGTNGSQYEGTLWLGSRNVLAFSDMTTSVSSTTVVPATVMELSAPNNVRPWAADAGTNGLAVDGSGKVFGCSQKVQGIVAIDTTSGTVSTVVNTDSSGRRFNSPNDLTIRSDGTIYFTDPDYQIAGRRSETGVKGVYRISPAKQVSTVDTAFTQPNGITLSLDESLLYVADLPANKIRRFNVAADGSTSAKQDFANVPSPDGGGIDCAGNLYWASNAAPGKIYVISPTGTQLGTISIGASDKPTNVAFGGTDHKTLYVSTSPGKVYAVSMNLPGMPF